MRPALVPVVFDGERRAGVGGGGDSEPGFDPSTVSGLTLDLDPSVSAAFYQSDDGTGALAGDGDPVGYALEQSGNNRTFTESTGSAKPIRLLDTDAWALYGDGVNDKLTGPANSNFITAASFTAFTVFTADAVDTNVAVAANVYQNDSVWEDSGAYSGLYLRSAPSAHVRNWDGNSDQVGVAFTIGARTLVRIRHHGGTLYISVNGGAESSVASGNTEVLTGVLHYFVNLNPGYFEGLLYRDLRYNTGNLSAGDLDYLTSGLMDLYGIS